MYATSNANKAVQQIPASAAWCVARRDKKHPRNTVVSTVGGVLDSSGSIYATVRDDLSPKAAKHAAKRLVIPTRLRRSPKSYRLLRVSRSRTLI